MPVSANADEAPAPIVADPESPADAASPPTPGPAAVAAASSTTVVDFAAGVRLVTLTDASASTVTVTVARSNAPVGRVELVEDHRLSSTPRRQRHRLRRRRDRRRRTRPLVFGLRQTQRRRRPGRNPAGDTDTPTTRNQLSSISASGAQMQFVAAGFEQRPIRVDRHPIRTMDLHMHMSQIVLGVTRITDEPDHAPPPPPASPGAKPVTETPLAPGPAVIGPRIVVVQVIQAVLVTVDHPG